MMWTGIRTTQWIQDLWNSNFTMSLQLDISLWTERFAIWPQPIAQPQNFNRSVTRLNSLYHATVCKQLGSLLGNLNCSVKDEPCGPRQLSRYGDSLRAGRSGDRHPVGGTRFSAPLHTKLGGPHPMYNGYRVSFPGIKRPGRGFDHLLPSSIKIK
jgi:hypothetical protein